MDKQPSKALSTTELFAKYTTSPDTDEILPQNDYNNQSQLFTNYGGGDDFFSSISQTANNVPNMTPYTQPDNLQGSFAYPENGDYSNTQQNTTLPNVDYGQNQYYSHSVDTSTAYGQMNANETFATNAYQSDGYYNAFNNDAGLDSFDYNNYNNNNNITSSTAYYGDSVQAHVEEPIKQDDNVIQQPQQQQSEFFTENAALDNTPLTNQNSYEQPNPMAFSDSVPTEYQQEQSTVPPISDTVAVKESSDEELDRLVYSAAASATANNNNNSSSYSYYQTESAYNQSVPNAEYSAAAAAAATAVVQTAMASYEEQSTESFPQPSSGNNNNFDSAENIRTSASTGAMATTGTAAGQYYSTFNYTQPEASQDFDTMSVATFQSGYFPAGVEIKICPVCSRRNEADANFCSKCGRQMQDSGGDGGSMAGVQQQQQQQYHYYQQQQHQAQQQSYPGPPSRVLSPAYSNSSRGSTGSGLLSNSTTNPRSSSRPFSPPVQSPPVGGKEFHDPLNRNGSSPLVSFGFGGKLVLMFPQTRSRFMKSSDGLTTQTTKTSAGFIQLHSVKRLVTAEQLINRQPLSKAKKKDIIKWIEGQQQANQANGKSLCTIVELLKLLADSDGKLFVSEAQSSNSRLKEKLLEWINTRGANRREEHALNRRYRTLPTAAAMTENADALDSVRQLILKGQQLDAVRVASEAGLWTHALIIAGMVGRETFDQISQAFSTAHLDPADPLRTFCSKNTLSGEACSAEFWRDNLTMLINNCPVQSLSERLVAMGQGLFANGLEDEASVCIMLSGTAVDGVDSPSGRLCLVGVDHLRNNLHFFRDLRAFHYTECYEAILRLQNSSFCLPHLQNYKLYYSTLLADCGYTEDAQKYLESISQLVKNFSSNTPYFHSQFYTLLRELDCRLSAALSISTSETTSWLSKAPIQGIFSAFDRGITKFIGGGTEGQEATAVASVSNNVNNVNNTQERQQELQQQQQQPVIESPTPAYNPYAQYYGYQYNSNTYNYSATATTETSAISHSQSEQQFSSYQQHQQEQQPQPVEQPQHTEQPQNNQFAYYQSYSYQNLPSYDYSAYSSSTPANADYSGYSNADYSGYSEGHSTSQQEQQPRGNFDEDELGFGNSSLSRSKSVPASLQQQQQQHSQSTPQPKPGTEADDSTRNEISESSYMALLRGFGSLFRREGGKNASAANGAGGGGPIVAKLGEKNNFRYDEKLKRWVNDSATSGDTSSTPNKIEPPPISRPPSAPPFAPPSTPMSLSANVSRAPSPAPYVPPMGGSFSQISSPAGPETPVRRASTQRKNARSRYVDPLNPDMQDTPSFDRGSSSFIPTPSVVGASVPRIMTPAPKGTEMK